MAGEAARAERTRLTGMARVLLAAGADLDQVAAELLRRTDSPISAIKALADAGGTGLGEAKDIVHRNLAPRVRAVTEQLWTDLLDAFVQPDDQPDNQPDERSGGQPAVPDR